VGIQSVLPLPNFTDLFIAVFVFVIVIWSGGVVYVIPVLRYSMILAVLLTPFSSTSLSLFSGVEAVYIVIVANGSPICKCTLDRRL
jgi:hypothetical protein